MDIEVSDVSYYVDINGGEKRLLNSVTAAFWKGMVTILMGHSGAGKTTLMDLVADRKTAGTVVGKILFGGKHIRPSRSSIAYVQAFDAHIGDFTVLQTLYYNARLRFSGLSEEEYVAKCHEAAAAVELEGAMEVPVGSELRKGISGGQKKLLSIAVELLAVPAILCMDEPTSGLDASTALQVAYCVAKLAQKDNKTVLCTVHSPSLDMLSVWQNVVVLASGQVAYFGPISELESHCSSLGYTLVSGENPIEYFLELLANDEAKVLRSWERIAKNQALVSPNLNSSRDDNATNTGESYSEEKRISAIGQYKVLILRHLAYTLQCIHGLTAAVGKNLLGGVMFGFFFYNCGGKMDEDTIIFDPETLLFTADCLNVQSILFTSIIFAILINVISVPSMFELNRLYKREQASNLYHPLALWAANSTVDILVVILGACIFVGMVLPLTNLNGNEYYFYFLTLLSTMLGYSQAKLCAWLAPDPMSGFIYFSLVSMLEISFSGFLIVRDNIIIYLRWAVDLNFVAWAVGGLINNEFDDYKPYQNVQPNTGYESQGEAITDYYGVVNYDMTIGILVLVGFFIGLELLVTYNARSKRSTIRFVDESVISGTEKGDINKRNTFSVTQNALRKDLLDADDMHSVTSYKQSTSFGPGYGATAIRQSVSSLTEHTPSFIFAPSNVLRTMSHRNSVMSGSRKSQHTYTEPMNIFNVTDANMIPPERQVTLTFRDVSYMVGNGNKKVKLLNKINGAVTPGQMCAVMGCSGAGKSTLLNVLACRAQGGTTSGSVFVNGVRMAKAMQTGSSFCAYIMQSDAHFPTLTVRETLEYAAMLRLRETSQSAASVVSAVTNIIDLLGLSHIENTILGSGDDLNVSAGQLRRVTIGVEILCKPSLIYADEPTSGLDSYLASTVVIGLKNLCTAGATVVCTIHQPSQNVFEKFDKLLLLSQGHLLYFGDIKRSKAYFESLGFSSVSANVAEFVIAVASDVSTGDSASKNSAENFSIQASTRMDSSTRSLIDSCGKSDTNLEASFSTSSGGILSTFVVMYVLVKRDMTNIYRRKFWFAILSRSVFVGFGTGVLWLNGDDFLDLMGFYVAAYLLTNIWLLEIIAILHEEKILFRRELHARATTAVASSLTIGLPMVALSGAVVFLFLICSLGIQDPRSGLRHFLLNYFLILLSVISNLFLNQFIGMITPNAMIHSLLFPGIVIPCQAMFAGYVVIPSTMFKSIRWGFNLSSMNWVMNGVFQINIEGNEHALGEFDFEELEDLYSWDATISACFLYLGIICFTLKVLTCITYMYHSYLMHKS